jgi:transcriptional regulator of acetoin/glycerol metabolism
MENKELIELRNTKPHNSKDWLFNAYTVQGKTVGEIANELSISVKLVHIKLKEFGIR